MNKQFESMTTQELTEYRVQTMRKMRIYSNLQMAKKIQLNSAYGALS